MKKQSQQQSGGQHSGAQLLEDLGHLAAALAGTLFSGRGQLRRQAQQKLELLLQRLPVVSRDEYDALHGMLQQARLEQESLKARLDTLEGKPVKRASNQNAKNPVNEKLTRAGKTTKKSSPSRNKTRRR